MKKIALKELPRVFNPGTGNKSSRVRRDEMIALNDINIGKYDFNAFIKMINKEHFNKDIDIDIILSNRQCKNRWGTAYLIRKKVLIYRQSVWVFLHEIAHIYNHHINPPDLRRRKRAHGMRFGQILNKLYILWTNYNHNYRLENVAFTYDEKVKNVKNKTKSKSGCYFHLKVNDKYIKDWKTLSLTSHKEKAHAWKQRNTALKYYRLTKQKYGTAELKSFII